MDITLNLILGLILLFAVLYGIFWATGRFGSPMAQKIVGIVCLIIFAVVSLRSLGVLEAGSLRL